MREEIKDMVGNKYNHLTVIGIIKKIGRNNRSMCKCVCDCGNEAMAYPYELKSGHKGSCGKCSYARERPSMRKDLTGNKYGNLTVVEMIYGEHESWNTVTKCRCVCDCGNEVITYPGNIVHGKQTSCRECTANKVNRKKKERFYRKGVWQIDSRRNAMAGRKQQSKKM